MSTDQTRKSFLKYMIGGLVGFGAGAASIPFLGSIAVNREQRDQRKVLVDLRKIPLGGFKEVMVSAPQNPDSLIPILVIHRTPDMIKLARVNDGGMDPQPDRERVIRPEWLIVSPVCTHLGCPVVWEPDGPHKLKRLNQLLTETQMVDASDPVADDPNFRTKLAQLEINQARSQRELSELPLPCWCHGSMFDYSGRIIKGPAKTNLRIPHVEFISDNKVEISIPSKV